MVWRLCHVSPTQTKGLGRTLTWCQQQRLGQLLLSLAALLLMLAFSTAFGTTSPGCSMQPVSICLTCLKGMLPFIPTMTDQEERLLWQAGLSLTLTDGL